MKEKEVTEKEDELIEAIRNLKKARHNPSKQLEWYLKRLIDEILEEN